MEQPLGFETHDRQSHVCMLKKAFYVLKQAPRTWYGRMDSFQMSLGFTKSKANSNLYFKVEGGRPMILRLFADGMFLTGEDELISDMKRKLYVEFEMKNLGMMHYFLGMEVWQTVDGISLQQGKYGVEILKRFGMNCKAMATHMSSNLNLLSDASLELVDATMYCQMIGSLMYLTNTRPYIFFVMNTLS